jgi:hypothetical protein
MSLCYYNYRKRDNKYRKDKIMKNQKSCKEQMIEYNERKNIQYYFNDNVMVEPHSYGYTCYEFNENGDRVNSWGVVYK